MAISKPTTSSIHRRVHRRRQPAEVRVLLFLDVRGEADGSSLLLGTPSAAPDKYNGNADYLTRDCSCQESDSLSQGRANPRGGNLSLAPNAVQNQLKKLSDDDFGACSILILGGALNSGSVSAFALFAIVDIFKSE
jgi:hypothetical protein